MRPSKVVTGSSGTHKRETFNLAVQFKSIWPEIIFIYSRKNWWKIRSDSFISWSFFGIFALTGEKKKEERETNDQMKKQTDRMSRKSYSSEMDSSKSAVARVAEQRKQTV